MTKKKDITPGEELEQQFLKAIHDAQQAPLPGGRDLPILHGIDRPGDFVIPQENVLVRAADILVKSGNVYTFGNSVVMQLGEPTSSDVSLVPLRSGTTVETSARGLLANLFVCQKRNEQFPAPKWFIEVLMHAPTMLAGLPKIQHHVRRPIFDGDFVLLGPGWHPKAGVLVHGPSVEPIVGAAPDTDLPAVERLPHHLRNLLGGFCFRSDADLANAVGMLLTGVLTNHFMAESKAIFPCDGNQPNLGKT